VPSTPHILVVEDDSSLLSAIAAVLENEGYRVSMEADGFTALDWLHKNEPPTMILLDLRMPRMNGWAFWARIRFLKNVARVPVVMISADSGSQERALSVGAAGFLVKPFTVDELIFKVGQVLRPKISRQDQ